MKEISYGAEGYKWKADGPILNVGLLLLSRGALVKSAGNRPVTLSLNIS
jgi:hypothetical protein